MKLRISLFLAIKNTPHSPLLPHVEVQFLNFSFRTEDEINYKGNDTAKTSKKQE